VLFIQDTWMATNNLTLTYGLRLDTPMIDDRPPANPEASAIFGYDNTNTIDGNHLLQPRFGFNYTFDSDRPTQLRGGVGLFSGAAANVWLANPFQNNGGITLGEFFSSSGTGIVFSPDPDNQPGSRLQPGQGSGGPLDLIDPELRQPAVWKANLAFDHQLPWWGAVASAEILFTRVEEGLYYENLNLGAPSYVGADGRLFYWGNPFASSTGSFNSGSANARGNRDTRFTDVTVLRPTEKGRGEQLTLGVNKPLLDSWGWGLNYTFTRATEVNPLTSSQAISNWANSFRVNPNDNVAVNSSYAIRDRFLGTLNYQTSFFGDYKTSVGLIYEGRSGRPYSFSFINDANGDGRTNDLFYVPSGPGDVIFTGGPAMEQAFFDSRLRDASNIRGGLHDLLRRCALAVLTSGSQSDDPRAAQERYPDFDIQVQQQDRGIKLELTKNAPARARPSSTARSSAASPSNCCSRWCATSCTSRSNWSRRRPLRPGNLRGHHQRGVRDPAQCPRAASAPMSSPTWWCAGAAIRSAARVRVHQARRLRAGPARPRHLHRLRPGRDEGADEGRHHRPRQAAPRRRTATSASPSRASSPPSRRTRSSTNW
jgi:hypothetical protein